MIPEKAEVRFPHQRLFRCFRDGSELTEDVDHLLVLDGGEVVIKLADGPEIPWLPQTHHLIAEPTNFFQPIRRRHGNRNNDFVRVLPLYRMQGRHHGCSRRDPIIRHDDRAVRQRCDRAHSTE